MSGKRGLGSLVATLAAVLALSSCAPATQDAAPTAPTSSVAVQEPDLIPSVTPTPSPTPIETPSATPTPAPAPVLFGPGSTGAKVKDLQARLRQIGWYAAKVTGTYDATTEKAVAGFQAKRELPVTGSVDAPTLEKLRSMTRTPTKDELNNVISTAGLDPRCLVGRAICISKATRKLSWVINGVVKLRMDVRFGADTTPTREGAFLVEDKRRTWISTLYQSSMPFSMFFSGGQAIHYSSDFAARGYTGASHGCVNVRDWNGIAWLFDQVRLGDPVIVY